MKFAAGRWSQYSADDSFCWVLWVTDFGLWIVYHRYQWLSNLVSHHTNTWNICSAFIQWDIGETDVVLTKMLWKQIGLGLISSNDLEKSSCWKWKSLDKKKDLIRWYGITGQSQSEVRTQWCKQSTKAAFPPGSEHLLILVNLSYSLLSFEWIGGQRTYPNAPRAGKSNA